MGVRTKAKMPLSAALGREWVKDCFKINGKQKIIMPKKGEYIKFRNFERKVNSPYLSYGDCESILVSEENEKQNPEASSTNK